MEVHHVQVGKYLQSLQMKEMIEDKVGSQVVIITTKNTQFLSSKFYCSVLKIDLDRMRDRIKR